MRLMHRAAILKSPLPSFSLLFSYWRLPQQAGRSSSTAGSITFTPSFQGLEHYSTWYLFFAAGSCLEISRIDVSSGVMTKTRLITFVPEGDTAFFSELNQAGTSIISDPVYSGNMTLVTNTGVPVVDIDKMFQNCTVGTLLSYYDSTLTDAAGDLRVVTSKITSKSGVVLASYRDVPSGGTAGSVFYAASTETPATTIVSVYTEGSTTTGTTYNFLQEVTTGGVSYIVPVLHDTSGQTARVRSYTLKYFRENW